MEDREIVALYWARSEEAIRLSRERYGRYCRSLALRILGSAEDAEEAENDAYFKAWSTIPPQRPASLLSYLAMLCRQSALDRRKSQQRKKRTGGSYELALAELEQCVGGGESIPDKLALQDALSRFLHTLPERTRNVFLQRYWWCCSIRDIAGDFSMGQSAVKMMLRRTRLELKDFLRKEGFNDAIE